MEGMTRMAKLLALALLAVGLAACSVGEPLDQATLEESDEIPPGPGLFSGEDGEFVIYRD